MEARANINASHCDRKRGSNTRAKYVRIKYQVFASLFIGSRDKLANTLRTDCHLAGNLLGEDHIRWLRLIQESSLSIPSLCALCWLAHQHLPAGSDFGSQDTLHAGDWTLQAPAHRLGQFFHLFGSSIRYDRSFPDIIGHQPQRIVVTTTSTY